MLNNFNCTINQVPQLFPEPLSQNYQINKLKKEDQYLQYYFSNKNKEEIVYLVGWVQAEEPKQPQELRL